MQLINLIEELEHVVSLINQGFSEDAIDHVKSVAKELDNIRCNE